MSLGLLLSGTLTDGSLAVGWLSRTQTWLHEAWGATIIGSELREDESGKPLLRFQLHPCAADVRVSALGTRRIGVTARTAIVGPGYHEHVCELIKTLGKQLAVFWDPPDQATGTGDDTGYLHSGDHAALESAVLGSLQRSAQAILDEADGAPRLLWSSQPVRHIFEAESPVLTPMGPRDEEWLRRVVQDPRAGIDVFPWWQAGQGAHYRLGRAVAEMWASVRWRRPVSDTESAQVIRILALLREAHREDPTLRYPWREWEELSAYSGDEHPVPPHEDDPSVGLVGYRRGDVRVCLPGGWSVVVPGSFAESWDEDGSFCAWAGGRTLWFSSLSIPSGDAGKPDVQLLPVLRAEERPVDLPNLPSAIGQRAGLEQCPGDGGSVHKLSARMALSGSAVQFTVMFDKPEDASWAIATVESVRHPDVNAPAVQSPVGDGSADPR